jgi:hypothetical protein
MRSHNSIASLGVEKIIEILGLNTISEEKVEKLKFTLRYLLNLETSIAQEILRNTDQKNIRDCLYNRLDQKLLGVCLDGHPRESNIYTKNWIEWYPGLENKDCTLGEMIDSLPGAAPEKIPFVVRLFENPESLVAFRGAVTLERHDILHILLGRGLLDQDEAFVLGYTMGTVRNLTGIESWLFKQVLKTYPEPYRIYGVELQVFDMGLEAGKECGTSSLADYPIENHKNETLGALRKKLGIDTKSLKEYFRKEKELLPYTVASARLPVSEEI